MYCIQRERPGEVRTVGISSKVQDIRTYVYTYVCTKPFNRCNMGALTGEGSRVLIRCIQPPFKASDLGAENSKSTVSPRATDRVFWSFTLCTTYVYTHVL